MDGNLEACIGRILTGEVTDAEPPQATDQGTAGTGFLVSDSHMLTCAHVVAQALGIEPTCEEAQACGRRLAVEIHTNTGRKERRTGEVVAWRPVSRGGANHSIEDIALLKLDTPSAVLRSVIFKTHEPGVTAKVYGFGERAEWVTCCIAGNGQHWTELDCERREILLGYSGAPVFDENHTRIFGMVVARENASKAHMIRVALLREVMRAASCEGIGEDDAKPSPLAAHIEMASKLLGEPDAGRFLQALQSSLRDNYKEEDTRGHFSQADRLCQWVGTCSPPVIIAVFDCILSSMKAVRISNRVRKAERDAAADAAIALYVLAACGLFDRAGHDSRADRKYVLQLPSSSRVVYAVIATALFGGVIKLIDDEGEPDAPNVMEVKLPAGTENAVMVLECCIYAQLLQQDGKVKAASALVTKPRPLSAEELAKLLEGLRYWRDIEHSQLTVVIGDHHYEPAATELSRDHRLPILVEHAEAVSVLLGVTAKELAAKFDSLWRAVKLLRSGSNGGR